MATLENVIVDSHTDPTVTITVNLSVLALLPGLLDLVEGQIDPAYLEVLRGPRS